MNPTKLPDPAANYLDFSGFQKLKKDSRAGDQAALQATAKQLESVFLNMMLKSMRSANSAFAEGNYLNSRDGEMYQDMYDHQLSLNMANGNGIGLATMIVNQMSRLQQGKTGTGAAENATDNADAEVAVAAAPRADGFELARYQQQAVPAQQPRTLRESDLLREIEQAKFGAGIPAPELALFSPQLQQDDIIPVTEPVAEPELYLEAPARPETWNTPEEFVAAILPHAQRAGRELNVDPQAIVAQAVLETGWGQRQIKDGQGNNSFNLFGIKAGSAWEGDVARKRTLEYRNGIAAPEYASFRSYSSLQHAFDDYVKFLKDRSRYDGVYEQAKDAKQWGFALQKAGYATDPKYGNKIASILESDILQSTFNPGYKSL